MSSLTNLNPSDLHASLTSFDLHTSFASFQETFSKHAEALKNASKLEGADGVNKAVEDLTSQLHAFGQNLSKLTKLVQTTIIQVNQVEEDRQTLISLIDDFGQKVSNFIKGGIGSEEDLKTLLQEEIDPLFKKLDGKISKKEHIELNSKISTHLWMTHLWMLDSCDVEEDRQTLISLIDDFGQKVTNYIEDGTGSEKGLKTHVQKSINPLLKKLDGKISKKEYKELNSKISAQLWLLDS